MDPERYDCIVVGLGGHGSAALYHLATRGSKVLGLEQHSIAHDRGSSHGESRIIRLAYHEHPDYVPLLQRAWDLWLDLQKKSGQFLLCDTKCIEAARPDFKGGQNCFTHALNSAQEYALEHEVLTGDEVNSRFPGYNLPPDYKALLGPGGILASERCILAHIHLARKYGAQVQLNEKVRSWQSTGSSGDVTVVTNKGRYKAKKLILAGGAWMTKLVPELQAVLQVERQVIGWFEILREGCCQKENFPVGVIHDDLGEFYWFPQFEKPGMKIGKFYHLREDVDDPADVSREISAMDEHVLREGIAEWFPAANGKMLSAAACMFTNTTDHHFIVDKHPNHDNVLLCSPCSGHGFKFCSVIGEILADLAVQGHSHQQKDLLKLDRSRPGFDELFKRFEQSASPRSRM